MCEQSHAEAADINTIVRRFARTGSLPPAMREGVYADVTDLQGPLSERIQWAQEIISRYEAEQRAAAAVPLPTPTPPTPDPAPAS